MNDLISRQAAIDALNALCVKECKYSKKTRLVMCSSCELGGAFEVLDDFPSADVEPVRHGRWEVFYAEELCGYRRAYYVCSSCFGSSDDEFDYCPNCGARMDGEADG